MSTSLQTLENMWREWIVALHEFVECYFVLPEKNKVWRDANGKILELGQWVDYQRRLYHSKRLSSKHITDLETVPGWWWSEPTSSWEDMLGVLREYIKAKGCMPQAGVVWLSMENNVIRSWDIGYWATRQQRNFKQFNLSKTQIDMLEKVEGWFWKDPQVANYTNEEWQKEYEILVKYVETHGQTPKYCSDRASERTLARWVSRQRISYKKKMLLESRAKALEKVPGWSWDSIKQSRRPRSWT